MCACIHIHHDAICSFDRSFVFLSFGLLCVFSLCVCGRIKLVCVLVFVCVCVCVSRGATGEWACTSFIVAWYSARSTQQLAADLVVRAMLPDLCVTRDVRCSCFGIRSRARWGSSLKCDHASVWGMLHRAMPGCTWPWRKRLRCMQHSARSRECSGRCSMGVHLVDVIGVAC